MSVRVVCRTRRRGEGTCRSCKQPILVGEEYRELVAIREDFADVPYLRETIHERCIFGTDARAWWEPRGWTGRRRRRRAKTSPR